MNEEHVVSFTVLGVETNIACIAVEDDTLQALLSKGELDCCLVKRILVVDAKQLLTAAHRALAAKNSGTLITRNVYSELLYNLSPSKNITQSLRTFGAEPSDREMVLVRFGPKADLMRSALAWPVASRPFLPQASVSKIKEVYGIKETEALSTSLLDSILTRIAVKCVI
ncbi:EKC/KEOPS complex subunit TPRKB-like [Cimex lectularius]|uniref:Uncharacterized protein n=1 Tax=Cimex lectularius TaxID=79782 RepID=A0A8I6TLD4_CIMLE|nr:EKC/KEOPS complex subunit TPRKB-like [Cimex lectularius]